VRYDGGKGAMGVAQWIINQIPPHRVYIEPFLGGGAVLRLKKPAHRHSRRGLPAQLAAVGEE
jgi:DNA adenine methylase